MPGARNFRVEWAESAWNDLAAIVQFIAEDDVGPALQTLNRLERSAASLKRTPFRGRIVPELAAAAIRLYRELVLPPWRIIYRVVGKDVHVLAVLDSRRNVEDLLLDRFLQ